MSLHENLEKVQRRYRCQIFMAHTEEFARKLLDSAYSALGTELLERLYQDQHDLFHDAEFYDGCDICDKEREEYG